MRVELDVTRLDAGGGVGEEIGEHRVDERDDPGHRPEVLDERDVGEAQARPGILVDAEVGAPEAVDRLLRIADDGERARLDAHVAPIECPGAGVGRREQHRELDLERIGVLELVEQHALPALRGAGTDVGIVTEQVPGEHQEVVELEGSLSPAFVGVVADERDDVMREVCEDGLSLRIEDLLAKLLCVLGRVAHIVDVHGPVLRLSVAALQRRHLIQELEQVDAVRDARERPPERGDVPVDVASEAIVVVAARDGSGRDQVVDRRQQWREVERRQRGHGCRRPDAVVVVVHDPRRLVQVLELDAEHQADEQRLLERGIVEEAVDELTPALLEPDASSNLVEHLEDGGEAGFERMLAQESLREPVQCRERRIVELGEGHTAPPPRAVVGDPLHTRRPRRPRGGRESGRAARTPRLR